MLRLGSELLLVKGVPFVLNHRGLFTARGSLLICNTDRNNYNRASLHVLAEPNFYILSTISTKWPGWLEAKQ